MIEFRTYGITDAILALQPNAGFSIIDDNFDDIDWFDETIPIPSKNEIDAKIEELTAAEPMRLLRIERDRRLTEVDWVVIRSITQGTEISQEWSDYMQKLRDLPSNSTPKLDSFNNLTNITWPRKPNG